MNLKYNKTKSQPQQNEVEDFGKNKVKKKSLKPLQDSKLNLKSKKFWQERFDDEGDDLERFIR